MMILRCIYDWMWSGELQLKNNDLVTNVGDGGGRIMELHEVVNLWPYENTTTNVSWKSFRHVHCRYTGDDKGHPHDPQHLSVDTRSTAFETFSVVSVWFRFRDLWMCMMHKAICSLMAFLSKDDVSSLGFFLQNVSQSMQNLSIGNSASQILSLKLDLGIFKLILWFNAYKVACYKLHCRSECL